MKQSIKFFQIAVNENFVWGLDNMGRVWRRSQIHEYDERPDAPLWKLIESPTMELSSKEDSEKKEES